MQTIEVLIVVDVEGALADQQDFGNKYIYMMDNTGYMSNTNTGEGGHELITTCYPGQTIKWSIAPICSSDDVSIAGFTGQILNYTDYTTGDTTPICIPVKDKNDPSWQGIVNEYAPILQYQYSVNVEFNNGTTLSFDPYLNVIKNPNSCS